eukprot:62818-Chlamydomonas_euryale.AAC.1
MDVCTRHMRCRPCAWRARKAHQTGAISDSTNRESPASRPSSTSACDPTAIGTKPIRSTTFKIPRNGG